MTMTNKIWKHLPGLLALCLTGGISGCSLDMQGTEVSSPPAQDLRTKVNAAFAANDQKATAIYRQVWESRDRRPATRENEIELLAIAGQLLGRDPQHYEEYLAFIKGKLGANDQEVLGSALSALSDAKDDASLRTLIESVSDRRMRIAIEATTALDYRYQSAKTDASRGDEARTIKSSLATTCASDSKSSPLRDFCRRNKF